jgi:transcriptional regulator with XRE-family HTH domain
MNMQRPDSHVGTIIRAARQQRGWTQAKLHIAGGVNLADISRIECGRLVPTRAQLERLADTLNIPRADVLPDEAELVSA